MNETLTAVQMAKEYLENKIRPDYTFPYKLEILAQAVLRLSEEIEIKSKAFKEYWPKLISSAHWKLKSEMDRHMLTWFSAASNYKDQSLQIKKLEEENAKNLVGLMNQIKARDEEIRGQSQALDSAEKLIIYFMDNQCDGLPSKEAKEWLERYSKGK